MRVLPVETCPSQAAPTVEMGRGLSAVLQS